MIARLNRALAPGLLAGIFGICAIAFCMIFGVMYIALTGDGDNGQPDLPEPSAQCNEMPKGMPNSPYVQVAWDDAQKYNICPRFFVNQINTESSFNPNARSGAGAVGIAQFMAGTAPTWGLKVGGGVDERLDPEKALDAAARMMQSEYKHYLNNGQEQSDEAYKKALAAYNAGDGNVQGAEALAKQGSSGCSDWFNCLLKLHIKDPKQPYNYVIKIMELKIPLAK